MKRLTYLVILTLAFSSFAQANYTKCTVGYVTHFSNDINFKISYSDLQHLLAAKHIDLVQIDTDDDMDADMDNIVNTILSIDSYRKNRTIKHLSLTLVDRDKNSISKITSAVITNETTKLKLSPGDQIQQMYQTPQGSPRPIAAHIRDLKIDLGLYRVKEKIETVEVLRNPLRDFANQIDEQCIKNL